MTFVPNGTIIGKAAGLDAFAGVHAAEFIPLQKAHIADVTDLSPEGLVEFFGVQMQQSRGRLERLLQQQEARNALIQDYETMEGILSRYGEKTINPDSPDWALFCQTAEKLKGQMAGSAAENQLASMWDAAMTPTTATQNFGNDKATAEAFAAANGAQVTTTPLAPLGPTGLIVEQYSVTANVGPAQGAGKDDIQSMVSQIKGLREGLNSDNTINMIRVQNEASVMSQISSACTNLVQKFHEARIGIIQNFK